MKIIDNIEQGTEEWFGLRRGRMTASHAQEIGNAGAGLETYINKMMAEYYSMGERPTFTNEHIERGNELEDQARSIYAFNTGNEVKEVGFIEYSEFIGCSPDGLVNSDGLLEIKCPDDYTYFQHLTKKEKAISSKYVWQMQMQMLISERQWTDYVAYNPNYEDSIFIHRIYPDKEKYRKLLIGFEAGIEKIKTINNIIKKN